MDQDDLKEKEMLGKILTEKYGNVSEIGDNQSFSAKHSRHLSAFEFDITGFKMSKMKIFHIFGNLVFNWYNGEKSCNMQPKMGLLTESRRDDTVSQR